MQPLILKPGVEPQRAADVLRDLAAQARNARSAGHEWFQVRDAYLQWVERVEGQLGSLTSDVAVISSIQNQHYWRLQDNTARFVRPLPMITAELERQQNQLDELAAELERRRDRVIKAPGTIAVVDTNVLLHYLPPDQIAWPDVVGSSPVRLIVPLRVVEELDLKKWGENKRLAARARDLLPKVLSALTPGGGPGALRDQVTIEVPVPIRPRQRPVDADEEVLTTCEEMTVFAGQPSTLITGDASMRIRAEASSVSVVAMPDRFLRLETTPPATRR